MKRLRPLIFAAVPALLSTAAHAGESEWVGQYISNKNTTMTIYGANDHLKISGRGEFSMYNAECDFIAGRAASCVGEGTRLKDRKVYQATYELVFSRDGSKVTSNWTATYPNGEFYKGTTHLTRVD